MAETRPLGDRIKEYEAVFTEQKINPALPFVMRLDGHGFSKFTKGLFLDINLHNTFVDVTKDLMKEYGAVTGYTHSDEISLLFYPKYDDAGKPRELHYGGRIQKMISTAAAFCTMMFNRKLVTHFTDKSDDYKEEKQSAYDRMFSGSAYFDCRVFQVPTDSEMFSYMFWRSQVDCRRNHAFLLSSQFWSKKQLDGINTGERIRMLAEQGVLWENEPVFWRRGSFIKRVPKFLPEDIIRHEYVEVNVDLTKFDATIDRFLQCPIYVGDLEKI